MPNTDQLLATLVLVLAIAAVVVLPATVRSAVAPGAITLDADA